MNLINRMINNLIINRMNNNTNMNLINRRKRRKNINIMNLVNRVDILNQYFYTLPNSIAVYDSNIMNTEFKIK